MMSPGSSKVVGILLCISSIAAGLVIADWDALQTEDENDGILNKAFPSPSWLPWKEQQRPADSIVLPIVSSVLGNSQNGFNSQSTDNSASSLFKQTSSALFNIAGEGFNQIKNSSVVNGVSSFIDERIPENVKTNVEVTGLLIGNTISGIGDIAFPEGENTSLIEGVSNVVNELKATQKELQNWPIQNAIVSSISDQASKLFGFSPEPSQTEKTGTVSELGLKARFSGSSTQSADDRYSLEDDSSKTKTTQIIIILITCALVLSLIVNIVLTSCLVQQKKQFKRMNNFVSTLANKTPQLQEQQVELLHSDRDKVQV